MNTPKERFQTSGHSGAFSKLVASEAFDPACDYALLQLLSEMAPNTRPGTPTDPLVGLDSSAQMIGAARVLEILKHLPEPIKPPVTPKKDTLHYG